MMDDKHTVKPLRNQPKTPEPLIPNRFDIYRPQWMG